MKIKDVHIDGFGVWTGLAVDSLPDGMTLFYGPNEAGKTTLMQFIRACFYGFTPERRQRYLPPVHGGTPGGAMRVTGPGGGYQIRRRVQSTEGETSQQSVMGHLTVTGQDGLAQGQHRLAMLLGQIDEPIFTNVFAIGLRELQELSTLDDTSAADELYKLSSGLDRVSLVDVMRSLRKTRGKLVDSRETEAGAGKLATLFERREKLKDEIGSLTTRSKRWSDLATQRRSQEQEIKELRERLTTWEHEARVVELASGLYETWQDRVRLEKRIHDQSDLQDLPSDAPEQLVLLESQLEERKRKIEQIKQQRRDLRTESSSLPLSRRMFELQSKIDAAGEQATWIEAIEEQIEKLDNQLNRARQELDLEAQELGLEEEDRASFVATGRTSLPDLTKQTLSNLSGPARKVKDQLYQLKRARDESQKDKKEADSLERKLYENLDPKQASDLHAAIKNQNEVIATLKQRRQLEQQLETARRHYKDLEKESVELVTAEALPVERAFLLGFPFLIGGVCLVYGFCHFLQLTWFFESPNPTTGVMLMLLGMMSLTVWYLGRERTDRSTNLDLEDCERQIDTLRRQIRELELERDEVESRLPTGAGSLETRLQDAEELQRRLESLLPIYHGKQASLERYKAGRKRAADAADGLQAAREQWRKALRALGLSEAMSPSSIRKLSEGYQGLLDARKKIEDLEQERDQRLRERAAVAKRIESLYLEALGPEEPDEDEDLDELNGDYDYRSKKSKSSLDAHHTKNSQPGKPVTPQMSPLEQLEALQAELARQQHWIKRRRELKDQDSQLQKQQAQQTRAIQRIDGSRRSIWAKCGVATADQFYELVDAKTALAELEKELKALNEKIQTIIGNQCKVEEVERELEGTRSDDLNRRWESLTERISQTDERIAGLQTRQGELAQEMRSLAEDTRMSHAQLELQCVERQIDAIARRWQILAMSSSLLEDVCATFEKERQPETLREASSFLSQLTDGKYTRIWTPLGTNQLNVDSPEKGSLSIEVLSRGTREAVFIALRLALAAAYARRGVALPLVLDDVLVNFDGKRALDAAKTLKTFAELGHQVMMFTCHDHIAQIFHDIDVQVRLLPPQGEPGIAEILPPPEEVAEESAIHIIDEPGEEEADSFVDEEEEPILEEVVQEETVEEELEPTPPEPPKAPVVHLPIVELPDPEPEPIKPLPQPAAREPVKKLVAPQKPTPQKPTRPHAPEESDLDWVWFERELGSQWFEETQEPANAPAEIINRYDAWWSNQEPPRKADA